MKTNLHCSCQCNLRNKLVIQNLIKYYRRLLLLKFFLDLPPTVPLQEYLGAPKINVPSLETNIQVVSSTINSSDHSLHRTHDNLPREQREALKSLRSLKGIIIIKPADKGPGVVVMVRQQYIDEAMRQLNNHTN